MIDAAAGPGCKPPRPVGSHRSLWIASSVTRLHTLAFGLMSVEEICNIIVAQFSVESASITPETTLEDISASTFDMVEQSVSVEETFRVEVRDGPARHDPRTSV